MGVGRISSNLGHHCQLHLQTEVCLGMDDDGGGGGDGGEGSHSCHKCCCTGYTLAGAETE